MGGGFIIIPYRGTGGRLAGSAVLLARFSLLGQYHCKGPNWPTAQFDRFFVFLFFLGGTAFGVVLPLQRVLAILQQSCITFLFPSFISQNLKPID